MRISSSRAARLHLRAISDNSEFTRSCHHRNSSRYSPIISALCLLLIFSPSPYWLHLDVLRCAIAFCNIRPRNVSAYVCTYVQKQVRLPLKFKLNRSKIRTKYIHQEELLLIWRWNILKIRHAIPFTYHGSFTVFVVSTCKYYYSYCCCYGFITVENST